MLSKILVKTVSLCVAVVFACNLLAPSFAQSDAFDDSIAAGNSLAGSIMTPYTPSNINLNATVPDFEAASAASGTYSSYYTNPAGMSSAASGEALEFVQESYTSRQKFDLSEDSTFGNKCLERGEDGKCAQWSLSGDLLTNTYADCTRVVVPEYENAEFQTCLNTVTYPITPECSIRKYLDSTVEHMEGPCSNISDLGVQDSQIYAVCKDNMELYRVRMGDIFNPPSDWAAVNPLLCAQIPGGCGCYVCPMDTAVVESEEDLPEGSEYLYSGYQLNWCIGDSGERVCNATVFKYYLYREPSTVERLYLRADSTCGREALDAWAEDENCVVWDYAKCDTSGLNCVYLIQAGQETGNTSPEECQTYPSVMYGNGNVMYDQQGYNGCLASCPTTYTGANCFDATQTYEDCNSGTCVTYPGFCSICSSCAGPCSGGICNNCTGCQNCSPPWLAGGPDMMCQQGTAIIDAACQEACSSQASIDLDDYDVCLPPDGTEGLTLNDKPITQELSYISFYTYQGTLMLSWLAQFGGPGVEQNANNWHTKIRFKCRQVNNTCADLIDQGCDLHSKRCLNEDCSQTEFTYRCGEDRITGYKVMYNCAGELRCIGTDCGAVTDYTANKEFAAAAAAGEILNMARVDSMRTGDNIIIFPGKAMECQSGPENCCDASDGGGISIGDYVQAGWSTYSVFSKGMSLMATAESYGQAITTIANTFGHLTGTATSTVASVEVGGIATTSTTVTSSFGTTTATTVMTGAEASTTAVVSTASATIAIIGTIMSVVAILYAVYQLATMIYSMMFACTDEDLETSMKLMLNLCHYVGTRRKKKLGFFTQQFKQYCCFNSILARVIHEQGRPQIGLGWGGGQMEPNCRGFTTQELSSLDFSRIDLSEYTQYLTHKTEMSAADIQRIQDKLAEFTPPVP